MHRLGLCAEYTTVHGVFTRHPYFPFVNEIGNIYTVNKAYILGAHEQWKHMETHALRWGSQRTVYRHHNGPRLSGVRPISVAAVFRIQSRHDRYMMTTIATVYGETSVVQATIFVGPYRNICNQFMGAMNGVTVTTAYKVWTTLQTYFPAHLHPSAETKWSPSESVRSPAPCSSIWRAVNLSAKSFSMLYLALRFSLCQPAPSHYHSQLDSCAMIIT